MANYHPWPPAMDSSCLSIICWFSHSWPIGLLIWNNYLFTNRIPMCGWGSVSWLFYPHNLFCTFNVFKIKCFRFLKLHFLSRLNKQMAENSKYVKRQTMESLLPLFFSLPPCSSCPPPQVIISTSCLYILPDTFLNAHSSKN